MTNHNAKAGHVIFGLPKRPASSGSVAESIRASEQGYTLVALIAVMTLMALLALAAAPSILQQAQREREKEAIFRGEEVADAIRVYYGAQAGIRGPGDQALPTSIDDLLQGANIRGRTKKLQVLRASAAHDPLSSTGEWRFIKPRSNAMADFVRNLMLYSENVPPVTNDPNMKTAQPLMAPIATVVSGLSGSSLTGDDSLDSSDGPFIGVSSRSKQKAVINYYGIDQHNQWVFTPLFR